MNAANKAVDALCERFCELATQKACELSGQRDLSYTGPDKRGFWAFHCPLSGPEDAPHKWHGTPRAWLKATGSALQAGCPKCSNGKADPAYLEAAKTAIGWVDDNVARPEFGQATYRNHEYTTADGKWAVRHTKIIFKDRRKKAGWQWSIMDLTVGAFGSYNPFKPSEFCAEHYPELKHFSLALNLYGAERFARVNAYHVVVTEGERDADTFNDLMAAAGEASLIATCLPHQTPTALSAHQRAVFEGRDVILIGDADEGGKKFTAAWGALLWDVAASIKIFPPEMLGLTTGGKDLTDAREQQEAAGQSAAAIGARLIEQITSLPRVEESMARIDWRAELVPTKEGGYKSDSIANAEIILSRHPDLGGRIRRDIRRGEPEAVDPPWGVSVKGVRAVANAVSAWLERTERFSPTVKALEAALNFESVAPAYNPFENLAGVVGDVAELDELFTKHFPLAVARPTAIKAARTFWADFTAKLRGDLIPQRILLGIVTDTPLDVARRLAGGYGLVHAGTINQGHLSAFARQGVVLIQIGLDAVYNQRTAPNNLANIFAPHIFNQLTQRRCPTPMFVAVGPAPGDRRTEDKADERVITLKLEGSHDDR